MSHNEDTLPAWAREKLAECRRKIDALSGEIERLKEAHGLLANREWFTVQGPKPGMKTWSDGEPRTTYRLWLLDRDSPHPVCSLGVGDVLLVGRAEKKSS